MDAVIFDLDGTLADSAPGLAHAANAMLSRLSRPGLALARIEGFIGNGVPALVERCLAATGGAADGLAPHAEAIFREIYDADPLHGTSARPGARRAIEDLRAAGARIGLCTNKPEAPARAICEGLGLRMDAVVGGDTLPQRKPDPAPLLEAVARLGARPERALYVGDGGVDARTARAAGILYAFVEGGYDDGTGADGAALHLSSLSELAEAAARL